MPEVILNLFQVQVKARKLLAYEIQTTQPETLNRQTKYRLAAKIAKKSLSEGPVFSVSDQIYASKPIGSEQQVDLDIEGTKIPFAVNLRQTEEIDLSDLNRGPETIVNRLVDWYYMEKIPASFRIENTNYEGVNIFAQLENRLYKFSNININEGLLRATRTFGGLPYLLLDEEFRITWEQNLWDSIKLFAKNVLNKSASMPDAVTIRAIEEKFCRTQTKRGVEVQGKNQVGEYELVGLDYSKNPDTPGTAGEKSQNEYFKSVYGSAAEIKDVKQPLAKVRILRGYHRNKENYHVPELLEFGYIPSNLKENTRLMSAIANIEKPLPRGKYAHIISFVQGDPFGRTKGFSGDEFVNSFVNISPEPVKVQATLLPPVSVKMQDAVFGVSSDSEFLSNIWKNKFHRVPTINKVVLLYRKEREVDITDFYANLQAESSERGMVLPNAEPMIVEGGLPEDYLKALGEKVEADIVISFFPRDEEIYDRVKEQLLLKHGVMHQNISYEKTLDVLADYKMRGNQKGTKSILTFISMQICAKLGGAPWAFNKPIYQEGYPILGLDVFHEANGSTTGGCAVFDPFGEYLYSEAKMASLEDILTLALEKFIAGYGKPKGLLIFRDGLSFTQERDFLLSPHGELEIVDKVLEKFSLSDSIFIMEKKYTHLRMFKKLEGIKVENPESGTVVLGSPFDRNEMLMVSQETYQGTVNPIFYKVIRPKDPDLLSIAYATHKLCRHHWTTNRAVKVPAPAVHANIITYMIRRVLGDAPTNPTILNRPFYL
jgi:hypothetical protein